MEDQDLGTEIGPLFAVETRVLHLPVPRISKTRLVSLPALGLNPKMHGWGIHEADRI